MADRLGLMWLCVNVHFGSGQRYSPFPCGRFRRPLHRSTYTSTSSGASPAELASPLNGCVPLRPRSEVRLAIAGRVRRVRWHFGLAPGRIVACSRRPHSQILAQYFVDGIPSASSCAVFAKWPPNRMRLSPSARHSMPPPAPQKGSCSMDTNRVGAAVFTWLINKTKKGERL